MERQLKAGNSIRLAEVLTGPRQKREKEQQGALWKRAATVNYGVRQLSESLLSAGDFRGPIGNVDELRVPDWGLSETVPGEPHLNRLEP